MKSVTGIQKITQAVYAVSSAKIRKMQARLKIVRSIADPMRTFLDLPEYKEEDLKKGKVLIGVLGGDRGLCGSYNATLGRTARNLANATLKINPEVRLITYGDKVATALTRAFGPRLTYSITDMTKHKNLTYRTVALTSDYLSKVEFDQGVLIYNWFKNAVTSVAKYMPLVPKPKQVEDFKNVFRGKYIFHGNIDSLENFVEFRNSMLLWEMVAESEVCEISARMNAMSGASKNTKTLLGSLRLQYNKTRQAKITSELCEIVAGAESSKKTEE